MCVCVHAHNASIIFTQQIRQPVMLGSQHVVAGAHKDLFNVCVQRADLSMTLTFHVYLTDMVFVCVGEHASLFVL